MVNVNAEWIRLGLWLGVMVILAVILMVVRIRQNRQREWSDSHLGWSVRQGRSYSVNRSGKTMDQLRHHLCQELLNQLQHLPKNVFIDIHTLEFRLPDAPYKGEYHGSAAVLLRKM